MVISPGDARDVPSPAPTEGGPAPRPTWQERYSRQIRFAPFGEDGQAALLRSSALIVGVGALGTHLASGLARAGIGRLWLVDRDVVEEHNLPRQTLFDEEDARSGMPKAVAAAQRLQRVNSACEVIAVADEFTARTLDDLDARPDLLLDGTDNFATRYVLNDLSAARGIPWIYGAALGSEGMAMAVLPGRTPCLRCILPEPPSGGASGTCETEGILEPTIAMVTGFQTAQALKILTGAHDAVTRGIFVVDVWRGSVGMQMQNATPAPDCAACHARVFPALQPQSAPVVSLCGRDAVQVRPEHAISFDLDALAVRLQRAGVDVQRTRHLARFTADGCRFSVFPDGRALLFGEQDGRRALLLYDRWVGAR